MITKVEHIGSVGQLLPSLLRHRFTVNDAYWTPNVDSSWCNGHTFVGYSEHMNRQGIPLQWVWTWQSSGCLHLVCLLPIFACYNYDRHAFCIPMEMKNCCSNFGDSISGVTLFDANPVQQRHILHGRSVQNLFIAESCRMYKPTKSINRPVITWEEILSYESQIQNIHKYLNCCKTSWTAFLNGLLVGIVLNVHEMVL